MKKIILAIALLAGLQTYAQQKYQVYNFSVVNPKQWVIPKNDTLDYELGTYQGSNALIIKRKIGNYKSASLAYKPGLNFKDGIIDLDIACPGKGGFVGLAFRIKDAHHYQVVYFRPGSSGTINAIQYMPEKKAEFNWWDYEATKYQAKAIVPQNKWFHVKAVIKGRRMEVYIDNAAKPDMVYTELDASLPNGAVGYWHGNTQMGAYKNLVVKAFN
ncbi:hypothetical protein [Mucilaginibacter celer]|uniref:DUF1080 domain-containing protein n=1 Tax=Mucilaginibacter celer TaxID=2305508 RepID=A0A494VMI1_9SPHI|nr:hypothetical protein [Mucilaginibacter celer]AYL94871.1 hypothetical protein HYN43_005945 [Mucilaginibacter celer]